MSGNLLSCVFLKYSVSIGASTSVFGLIGMQFVFYRIMSYRGIDRFNEQKYQFYLLILVNVLINVDWNQKSIDVYGHLGGGIAGYLVTMVYYYSRIHRRYGIISMLVLSE